MKIVSFYFDPDPNSNYYLECSDKMKRQCESLGLSYYIKPRQYGDDWISNTRGKASFILEAFHLLHEPFLWVDVDCKILQKPVIDLNCDMASMGRKNHRYKIYSSVHYINYTDATEQLLKMWQDECSRSDTGDHSILNNIISNKINFKFNHKLLPLTFLNGPVIQNRQSESESKIQYLESKKGIS